MEGKKICYFHKFNFCKKKDCKYFHSSEVCDGKCEIKTCLKRHPNTSLCMFHTMFKKCRNNDSCKFLHETPLPVEAINNEEIQTLKRKLQELEEDHRNIKSKHKKIIDDLNDRIISLEATVKDLTDNKIIAGFLIQQEDEMMDDHNKNDESSFMTSESSYYIWEDLEFKEILKEELIVTNNLKTNINDIVQNLKPRKIDETISKFQILKYNVQNDVTRMKEIERHSENKEYSDNFYEMIDKFMKMIETLEHIAKNKFRPVVEKELKEFNHDIVEEVLLEKQGKIYGMFDV